MFFLLHVNILKSGNVNPNSYHFFFAHWEEIMEVENPRVVLKSIFLDEGVLRF